MLRQSIRSFSTSFKPKFAKMTLIGTIGTDLQKQTTSTGKDFLKYAIAVNHKGKTTANDTVSWFNIAVFNPNQVDFMEKNLAKGSKIYLEAEVKNTSYTKDDGSKTFNLMLFQNNFEVIKYPKKPEQSQ
ncbi:ssDNA-binding protein, mitochondrial [Pichia californica]|uniref:Single-stranded DNA-binding protein n=1 Tax=Pichia californica TaxID=460514 RepID=A0A9P7BHV1_9ASCO|nr:ssDNA-binding protein, mitochondrial [[Candida] californica]KAG0689943.1 ssDNA-binding protein, mitochondrial [[Candida] californica]